MFKTTCNSLPALRKSLLLAGLAVGLLAPGSAAQAQLDALLFDRDSSRLNDVFQNAFADAASKAQAATAEVLDETGDRVILATAVSADGLFVTKASELPEGKLRVRLAAGPGQAQARVVEVKLLGTDAATDVALLDAPTGTTTAAWARTGARVGQFVVTVGTQEPVLAVGVGERKVPGNSPLLGVGLGEALPQVIGVPVQRVLPDSGAAAAGLEVGDVIVTFMGVPVASREALVEAIGKLEPDVPVELSYRRGDRVVEATTTLGRRDRFGSSRARFQNEMGGALSQRGGGFPLAFQHDTILRPVDVGGPVVDVDGNVLGVNISRSGRVETYTLPPAEVRRVVAKITEDVDRHASRQ